MTIKKTISELTAIGKEIISKHFSTDLDTPKIIPGKTNAVSIWQSIAAKNEQSEWERKSRTVTKKEIDGTSRQDPWLLWHVTHIIGLVLIDKAVQINLSTKALQVVIETPYAGTYEEAKRFIHENNLRQFVIENNLTYERLREFYGNQIATEITTWAHQLNQRTPPRRFTP